MEARLITKGSIAAIVPTFERPALLRECLGSLLAQTRPLAEIVVVDDGSTTDIAAAISDLKGPIRVVRQANRGKAAALNNGLRQVSSDYLWICDDDDIALADAAERLGAALDASTAGFAYGEYVRFRDDPVTGRRDVFGPGYWPPPHAPEETFQALLDDMFIFQFSALVRRRAYEAVGPFREDLVRSQDYDMMLRLARRFTPVRVGAPVFMQRDHQGPRGSAQQRFEAAVITEKWLEYDQKIFTDLHADLPVEAYAPPVLAASPESVRERGARLKRGCAMARRKLWDLAFDDFRDAARLGAGSAPLPPEIDVARSVLGGKHGCREVVDDSRLRQLTEAFRVSPYGRRMLAEVARPLRWRARGEFAGRRYGEALAYMRAIWSLVGPGQFVQFLCR